MTKRVIIVMAILLAIAVPISAQVTIFTEDFSGEWNVYSPPPGWTILEDGGPPSGPQTDWDNGGWANYYATDGVPILYWCCDDYFRVQTDEFVSPSFDCSGLENIRFRWQHELSFYGSYDARILGSTNGGSSWDYEIYNYSNTTVMQGFATRVIDWADGEPDVAIKFTGYGAPWDINWWNFDDITITGEEGGGPAPEGVDLEMADINRPFVKEVGGEGFNPSCKIYNPFDGQEPQPNFLEATVDAEVRCRIKDMATQQTVYEDVLNSYPLEFGYNDVDNFRLFTPEGNMLYEVLFVVTHPEDPDEQNNDMTLQFSTEAGVVVDAVAVVAPDDNPEGIFKPKGTFVTGEAEAVDVLLHCAITDATYHAAVYTDEQGPVTIPALDSIDQEFVDIDPDDFTDGSMYTVTFWATDEKGGRIGDEYASDFTWHEAIVENPVVTTFALKVTGTTVNFDLSKATSVNLRVYDVAGTLVSTLAAGNYAAGSHAVNINGLGSGVYFVKLVTPFFTDIAKVTVVK